MTDSSAKSPPELSRDDRRVRGVDVLRGLAMLGVIAIHARPLEGWAYHDVTVGRSVPIFIVLVGVSAQLWWQKQQAIGSERLGLSYLQATLRRLAFPYWTWLLVMLLAGAFTGRLPDSFALWLLSPLGYVPWAGPTWFIAAIVFISLVVPLLHWAVARVGPVLLCAVGLVVTWYCHEHGLAIMAAGRAILPLPEGMKPFFIFWIFAPVYFWHLSAGLWLGRHRGRIGAAVWSVAALGVIWGVWAVQRPGLNVMTLNGLRALMDVPLTVLLLSLAHPLSRVPWLGPALSFVGRSSWGMYLGHALIFSALEASGRTYQFLDVATRVRYFGGLFLGGLLLTVLGRWLRARLGARFPVLASHPPSARQARATGATGAG